MTSNKNIKNSVLLNRVLRGVKWLDKNNPGWENKINLEGLRLSSTSSCVLGQLYNQFFKKIIYDAEKAYRGQAEPGDKTALTLEQSKNFGFFHSGTDSFFVYDRLTDIWKLVVKKIRLEREIEARKTTLQAKRKEENAVEKELRNYISL